LEVNILDTDAGARDEEESDVCWPKNGISFWVSRPVKPGLGSRSNRNASSHIGSGEPGDAVIPVEVIAGGQHLPSIGSIARTRSQVQRNTRGSDQCHHDGSQSRRYDCRTGTGKTMAIMLPASSISGGTTIVTVPLRALQDNLQERCEKAQISSVIWSS